MNQIPSFRHLNFRARVAIPSVTRAAYESPRFGAGMFAIVQHELSIHEDISHAGRILMRLFVCGVVLDPSRIEDDDICKIVWSEKSAAPHTQVLGSKPRQFV